jgi:tetratricopeptide (TPR) repeat protein
MSNGATTSAVAARSDALQEWLKYAPPPNPLESGQRWNVFLSYRSVNRTWVINLYDVLRDRGHKVFLDQCVIAGGDPLIQTLEDALDQSQAGVLVWSSASADSQWVRREYETMERRADRGFRFVPVRLDDKKLPTFAERRVFLDFSQYPDGPNGGELLRLLHAVVGLPLSDDALRFANVQDEAAKDFTAKVKAAVRMGSEVQLRKLFDTGGPVWETSSALGCAVAEGLTKLGKPEAALEVLDGLDQRFPRAIRPKQLRALALARHARQRDLDEPLEEAQLILGTLYERGERDPETLGIYARTWMDRYEKSKNLLDLQQSRDYYAMAFESAQDDYYTGVNAAAKSVFLGTPADLDLARTLATRVQRIVESPETPDDYWKRATAGEVQLIRGNYEQAGKVYAGAVAKAPTERASHESTWLQACRLMKALASSAEERGKVRQAFAHLPDCVQ